MTCLPEPDHQHGAGCTPARPRRRTSPHGTLIVVIIFVAAAIPLLLISMGMAPASALSTAGAVTAFALGATHQIVGLLATGQRAGSRRVRRQAA
jgi:VIT1/CCC1 family predicted Fe2+/Mn2+ transporter